MRDLTNGPPVTLGVPVYNGEDYFQESLAAIQEQDFTDLEVLIWDNASTDATQDIARDIVAQDERFRYHRNDENVGGAINSNLLLAEARAPLFKWAYHDDIMDPTMVRRCVEVLDEGGPEVVLAYPRVRLINRVGDIVGEHSDADLDIASDDPAERVREILVRFVTQTQFGVMRTAAARAAGGVSVDVAGEIVLPLALALRGKLELVPEQLLLIREHEDRHGGDRASEVAWVDPSRPSVPFPYSRATWLFLKAIAEAPLTAHQRRTCYTTVLRHFTMPTWRTFAGDLVRLPRDLQLVKG